MFQKILEWWEFPGGPVVIIRHVHCGVLGSLPGLGTKILQAMWFSQKNKWNKIKQANLAS